MWLANETDFLKQLSSFHHLYQLMRALSKMAASSNQTKAQNSDPLSMWHEVQSLIKNSSKIGAALVAAIFSKCIAMEMVNQLAKSKSSQVSGINKKKKKKKKHTVAIIMIKKKKIKKNKS